MQCHIFFLIVQEARERASLVGSGWSPLRIPVILLDCMGAKRSVLVLVVSQRRNRMQLRRVWSVQTVLVDVWWCWWDWCRCLLGRMECSSRLRL